MKHGLSLALFVGLVALACGAAPAPEAVTIKFKIRAAGDTILVSSNETTAVKVKIVDGQGKVLVENNENSGQSTEYKETVLKREGTKPATKLEREYSKAVSTKGGKTEDLGLKGKTVIIEKKGDKYTFTFKGGEEVKGAAAAALSKEFSPSNVATAELMTLMQPKGPVKVGDTWRLDVPSVVKELNRGGPPMEVDLNKGSGTGKLLKAYQKDGKQFGEILFKLEVPLKSLNEIKFAEGAKEVFEMTLDTCIDGSSEAGTMKGNMKLVGNGTIANLPGSNATFEIVSGGIDKQEEPAKK